MGDGGSANDPSCNAQRDDTLLGKLLRIDVDQSVNTPPFYGIPPSNPFAAPGLPLDEIWAKGLRNPWWFSFDRATGDLYIAGVYLYGDYCFGWLFGNGQMLTPNVPQLTSFGEDSSGEIYLGTETGRLFRIVPPALLTTTPTPTATVTPTPARTPPVLPPRPRSTPRVVTFPN